MGNHSPIQEINKSSVVGTRKFLPGEEKIISVDIPVGNNAFYTVPAGKVFLLDSGALNVYASYSSTSYLLIQDNDAGLFHYLAMHVAAASVYESYLPLHLLNEITLYPGWQLRAYLSSGGGAYAWVHGFECNV